MSLVVLGEEAMKLPLAPTPRNVIHFDVNHNNMIGNDQFVLQYIPHTLNPVAL